MGPMPGNAQPDTGRGQRLALIGLLVNIGLASVKLLAGLLGHSYALVADAVESMTDIVGSVVIWGGLHIASKPADENHPYGHGKAEAIAALMVSMMILAAGVGIAAMAVAEIFAPRHAPARFTLVVLVVVVIVKEVMFRIVRRAGAELDSNAVRVDAWHHRSDAITSAAAFVGISVALWGGKGYEPADDIAALVAAGVIIFNAMLLLRTPIRELMDQEPADAVARAREIAAGVAGVSGIEKVAGRGAGGRVWLEMHVEVAPGMSVLEAHAVGHCVKDAVKKEMPGVADVLVHIEPAGQRGEGRPGPSGVVSR